MSAAANVAEKKGRIEKVFLNTHAALNENGIYAVQLWSLGVPHTVIVDDFLPVTYD